MPVQARRQLWPSFGWIFVSYPLVERWINCGRALVLSHVSPMSNSPNFGKSSFSTAPIGSSQWAQEGIARTHMGTPELNIFHKDWRAPTLPNVPSIAGKVANAIVAVSSTPAIYGAWRMFKDWWHANNGGPLPVTKKQFVSDYPKNPSAWPGTRHKQEKLAPKPRLVGVEPNPGPKPKTAKTKKTVVRKKGVGKMRKNGAAPKQGNTTMVPTVAKSSSAAVTTSYVGNSYTQIPDIRPVCRIVKTRKNGYEVDVTVPLGNLGTAGCQAVNGVFIANQVILSVIVDHSLFVPTLLEQHLALNENMKVIKQSIAFVASQGFAAPGLFSVFTDPDAGDPLTVLQVIDLATLSAHATPRMRAIGVSDSNIPSTLNLGRLWTDPTFVQYSTQANGTVVSSNDVRLSAAGVINVVLGDSIASTVASLGNLWLTLRVFLWNSQKSDMGSLIFNGRAMSTGNGATLMQTGVFQSGTNSDFFSLLINTANDPNAGQIEYVYNPRNLVKRASPGTISTAFNLPVGMYHLICLVGVNVNASGIVMLPSVSNGTAQFYRIDGPEGNVLTSIDYSGGVIGISGSPTTQLSYNCRFRVTSTSGNNLLANIGFGFSATFTGTCSVLYVVANLIRVPVHDSNPVACFMPHGYSSGSVGLSQREAALLSLFNSGDVSDRLTAARSLFKIQDGNLENCRRLYGLNVAACLDSLIRDIVVTGKDEYKHDDDSIVVPTYFSSLFRPLSK